MKKKLYIFFTTSWVTLTWPPVWSFCSCYIHDLNVCAWCNTMGRNHEVNSHLVCDFIHDKALTKAPTSFWHVLKRNRTITAIQNNHRRLKWEVHKNRECFLSLSTFCCDVLQTTWLQNGLYLNEGNKLLIGKWSSYFPLFLFHVPHCFRLHQFVGFLCFIFSGSSSFQVCVGACMYYGGAVLSVFVVMVRTAHCEIQAEPCRFQSLVSFYSA